MTGPGAGRPSRRHLLAGGLGLAGGAAAGAGTAGLLAGRWGTSTDAGTGTDGRSGTAVGSAVEPFHGPHQAGIGTAPQAHATFVALDLRRGAGRAAIARMMRLLSDDASRLSRGRPALADTDPELATVPARLTVTFGFGPGLFTAAGLEALRPPSVRPLPPFGTDRLEDRCSGGDLLLQVAADDPVSVSHALRMLTKDARAFATVRWLQRGFRRARGSEPSGTTMRNLLGQLDGTVNPRPGTADFDRAVWAAGEPAWFAGGSVLVLRRVRLDLEAWDAFDRAGKELVMGRRLDTGAPLTGRVEQDVADLDAVDAMGFPVIADTAHIRLARARTPVERMLRRGYNYDEGPAADGTADAGLLFAAYQADADTAFVPIQRRLAADDALNPWVRHIGSAVFALPPGCPEPGGWIGQGLLDG